MCFVWLAKLHLDPSRIFRIKVANSKSLLVHYETLTFKITTGTLNSTLKALMTYVKGDKIVLSLDWLFQKQPLSTGQRPTSSSAVIIYNIESIQ